MSTDRIEKHIFLKAPLARVWGAISDSKQFGTWFEVALDGAFTPGARVPGRITTRGHDHLRFELVVEKVEPETLLSYRWHPYAIDPKVDYSKEPMTLVEFRLQPKDGGVELTVTESGFDQLPLPRREEAFRMNDGGWSEQVKRIEKYVTA